MRTFGKLAVALAAILWGIDNSVAQDGKPTPLVEIVKANFSQWDKNGDGVLSKDEVFAAMGKTKIHGEEAAAVTAISKGIRNDKHHLPPITKKYLIAKLSDKSAVSGEQATGEGEANLAGNFFPFEKNYQIALHQIFSTSRELFPQRLPSFEATRQGKLGDCSFVSTVGALVYRNPSAVKSLFTENPDGSTTVNFGNGQSVKITLTTDSDIALFSSAGTNGLWFTVLEKAYRRVFRDKAHPDRSIYEGFGSGDTVPILDGYAIKRFALGELRDKPSKLTELRQELVSAQRVHRLIKAGTPAGKKTPGITPGHEYAILGYKIGSDVCHVWNPHGEDFKPKGPEGLQNGYTTKGGEFDIPLKELIQIFNEVQIETKTKAKAR